MKGVTIELKTAQRMATATRIIEQTPLSPSANPGYSRHSGADGDGSGVVPAKIVSKSGAFYLVNTYEDGFDGAVTETNLLATVLMLNMADELPAGSQVLIVSSYASAIGGG